MPKELSNAEKYVVSKRACDAQYAMLTAEERAEADSGLRWLAVVGKIYTGPAMRGRPPGSKNRKAEVAPATEGNMLDGAPNAAAGEGL